jgi:hypothetical protein
MIGRTTLSTFSMNFLSKDSITAKLGSYLQ